MIASINSASSVNNKRHGSRMRRHTKWLFVVLSDELLDV